MPGQADKVIKKVMDKGNDESSAIRILKSNNTIHQDGKHLAMGPPSSTKTPPQKTGAPMKNDSWKRFQRKKKESK